MVRLARAPLRLRLTLAFSFAFALVLAGASAYIFLEVKSGLDGSLDSSLRARAGNLALLAAQPDGAALRNALAVEPEPAQVLDGQDRVLIASPGDASRPLLTGRTFAMARRREVRRERREADRLLGRPAIGGRVIAVSTSMRQRERALESLSRVLLIGGPLVLLLAGSAGYLVAAGALRPVERMRGRARGISSATPDARLPLPESRDELRRLGETLNAMLERIEEASEHERAFLATASHELRTPLTVLRGEVGLALHPDATEDELRTALASIGEEVDRLDRLAEDLLVLARSERGGLPVAPRRLDVADEVKRVAERVAKAGRRIAVTTEDGLIADADPARLDQAIGNLVENALHHGAEPVAISACGRGPTVEIHVVDHGDGFADDELPHVFDRFHGRRAGGFGLGLAIVAAIAAAHGGTTAAANTANGADVWLTLPRV